MSAPVLPGPYEVGELLAEGGTSTVYAALRREGSYRRPVAVKVLRQELAGTEAAFRFRAERQILARLEHPNIARLYDGGETADGRPFLVLERIDGLPLDVYCDAQRLGVEERLRLFLKVCGAVQHAHRNLLVHRDLKPSNVLVNGAGEPKLLDFGIAKPVVRIEDEAEGAPSSTRYDSRTWTPGYASPEQIRGQAITTASDVYSLGVALYRLLTGRGPYGPVPVRELERAICETAPPRPSAVAATPKRARRLRGDLDTILLKALAKEPERRYRSAAELAEDLERHLESRPIAAHPDTATYLAWKFARRHRAGVTFALLLGVLFAGWIVDLQLRRHRLAREKERTERAFAFLVSAFQQAAPRVPGTTVSALAVVDSVARSIGRELQAEPEMQARLLDRVGSAYWNQRRLPAACRIFERALTLRERPPAAESPELAWSHLQQAICRDAEKRPQPALRSALRSVAMFRRFAGSERLGLAGALSVLGDIQANQRRFAEAKAAQQEAVALARGTGEAGRDMLAHHLLSLARAQIGLGEDEEAERSAREAFSLQARALKRDNRLLLYNEWRLAKTLAEVGRSPEAESRLRHVIARAPGQQMPDVDRYNALIQLSEVLAAAGRTEEALAVGREALPLRLAAMGGGDPQGALIRLHLARLLAELGRVAEAEPLAREGFATLVRTFGESSVEVSRAYLTLAQVERRAGRLDEALAQARTALAILERLPPPDARNLARAQTEIARVHLDRGQDREALPHLERAHGILARNNSRDSARRAEVDLPLGELLLRLGRKEEAGEVLRGAAALLVAEYGPGDARAQRCREGLRLAAVP